MSELFSSVKPGDTVHYLTQQGDARKGKVVMNRGTHLVINRGKGQPQVVNDKNYIKHERGGKVVGALLSRVHHVKEEEVVNELEKRTLQSYDAKAKNDLNSLVNKGDRWKNRLRTINRVKGLALSQKKLKDKKYGLHEVSKELAKRYVIAAVKDINHSSREAEGARTAAYADYMNKKAVKRSNAIAKNTKALQAYKDHVWGKDIYKEDSKDAEGAAERVAKTKKHKKKLHEVSNSTLTSYVTKAIADRKERTGAELGRLRTGLSKYYANDNGANKKISQRSAGIKKAVAKIASNLPAEPLKAHTDGEASKHGGWSGMESVVNEVSAPGKEEWIKANKARFIARYGKEKGLRVLYAKAWKDSKNESVNEAKKIERYTTHHDDYMVTSTTGPAGHSISVRQGGTLIAQRLGGRLITNSKSGKKDTKLQDVIKAHTDHPEVQKFLKTNEARENEWAANQQLAGQSSKSAKGHYLMRDGRKLSGPHSPEEAVKAYKNLSSQGTDTKGVKIVHVKETHMYEVSLNDLLAEAKVEKAAKLAISLKKKAKGNKHVETEPKLDIPDRTNTGTIEGNPQEQENVKV